MAGVVGIDIPVSRFEGFAPKTELGPLGYTFGLNTNGFLIFHPKLSALSNYLEDPAHNDIEDVEGNGGRADPVRVPDNEINHPHPGYWFLGSGSPIEFYTQFSQIYGHFLIKI